MAQLWLIQFWVLELTAGPCIHALRAGTMVDPLARIEVSTPFEPTQETATATMRSAKVTRDVQPIPVAMLNRQHVDRLSDLGPFYLLLKIAPDSALVSFHPPRFEAHSVSSFHCIASSCCLRSHASHHPEQLPVLKGIISWCEALFRRGGQMHQNLNI